MRAFWSVKEAGGVQKCPVRDGGLWMLQFSSKLNKQYLIWKLTSSAKIWDLIEVAEAHTLASVILWPQEVSEVTEVKMKKIWGENPRIPNFWLTETKYKVCPIENNTNLNLIFV